MKTEIPISLIVLIFMIGMLIGVLLCVHKVRNSPMFCPECGKRYTDSATYCEYDGTLLKEIG